MRYLEQEFVEIWSPFQDEHKKGCLNQDKIP